MVCESFINGVNTQKMDRLAAAMGIDGISGSQVSKLVRQIDQLVDNFCQRPLDRDLYPYIWLDAISQPCREVGRVFNVAAVIATGVNVRGYWEIPSLDVFTSENKSAWNTFL